MRVLVTGGARSGKSTYAEMRVRTLRDVDALRASTPQGSEGVVAALRASTPQGSEGVVAALRASTPQGSEGVVAALRASTPQGSEGETHHRLPEELAGGACQRLEGPCVDYVATGYPASDGDPDWAARVQAHQQRRPAGWTTIETLDVASVLRADSTAPLLVDCVALWLTRTADDTGAWSGDADAAVEARVADLVDAVARTSRDVVLVTNEVGLGVVPDTASGRWFRDALGRLNMALAAACDEVWLCVAGIPVQVKHG